MNSQNISGKRPESTIFIAYSNAKVNMLNLEARRRLDFKSNPLTKSECLVVSANNHLYGLNNGDQVTVLEMGQKVKPEQVYISEKFPCLEMTLMVLAK